MPRAPRHFVSGQLYELTFRARRGLPLPCLRLIELLIKSAIARTQRDYKVHICHFIFMANHPHLIILIKDAELAKRFYEEIKKRLTDTIKRLTGIEQLNLWEPRPNVAKIETIETAISHIAYVYANPSRANLVTTIGHYPGFSSYQVYKAAAHTLTAKHTEDVPYIRMPQVPRVPRQLTESQDKFHVAELQKKIKKKHQLILEPNVWMKAFGIRPVEVEGVNKEILEELQKAEARHELRRQELGQRVIGPHRLREQPIMKDWIPKRSKTDRRIFVICQQKEPRIAYIQFHKELRETLRERYIEWAKGDFTKPWPPGTFRPPMPPLANALQ